MKRTSTAAEKLHLARVAGLGCILCSHLGLGTSPAEIHHARTRHGWGRSSHMDVIPLCWRHHRGEPGGIHSMGRAQFFAVYLVTEMELLEKTKQRLGIA